MESSAHGYKTTVPLHREGRAMLLHREKREKAAIEGQIPAASMNPLASLRQSAGYAKESERLQTNAEHFLREERATDKAKYEHQIGTLKTMRAGRHEALQRMEADALAKAEQDAKLLAGTSMRNTNSVKYNIINHHFMNMSDMREFQYKDDFTKFSYMTRVQKTDRKNNPAGYNIINGMERNLVKVPPMPVEHSS
jgi:hypothetical protein